MGSSATKRVHVHHSSRWPRCNSSRSSPRQRPVRFGQLPRSDPNGVQWEPPKDPVTRTHEEGKTLPGRQRRGERLVGLLIVGIVLLNYPVLSLVSIPRLIFGIPILYAYLFAVWVLLIVIMVLIFRDRPVKPSADRPETKD